MNKFRPLLNVMAVATLTLMVASVAQAQATRTWVSGVGDDANPCSRTAPCKTFAGAVSKTAVSGEIDCIDPGGFGTVTITKSLTIDGTGTFASILSAGTNGVNVNDSASATPQTSIVTLRSLSINGAGTGIQGLNVTSGKTLYVENVEIFGMTGNGVNVALTAVPSGAAGYMVFLDDVDVRDLRGASSIGVKLSAPGSFVAATMDHVRTERIPTGVQVGNNAVATIRNSLFTLGGTGVEMLNGAAGGAQGIIENTMLTNNTTGLAAGSGSTTRLSQVSIILNSTDISAGGGTVRSSGNNRILDNTSVGVVPTIVNPK
jgi:hypothetical protein